MRAFSFAVAAVAILFVGALAGCLDTGPKNGKTPVTNLDPKAQLLEVLNAIPVLTYDRMKAINWWENFVTTYNHREWGTPVDTQAAAYLAAELKAAGFQTQTLTYKVPYPAAGAPAQDFLVVRGLHMGTTSPSHRIVLVAHYDVVSQTPEGAYDDGSGVAVEMEICKLLVKVQTNKTIECDFFDGEEKGLVASQAYTRDYPNHTAEYTWDQAFGYDMTGLNWPGFTPWKLWTMIGTDTTALGEYTSAHHEFLNVTAYEFLAKRLGTALDNTEIIEKHDRNSDEQNFKKIGIPIVRYAGGRKPGMYPMYHQPGDVTPYVYNFACQNCTDLNKGKEAFAKGVEFVVLTSYYTILGYDKYDPKKLPF